MRRAIVSWCVVVLLSACGEHRPPSDIQREAQTPVVHAGTVAAPAPASAGMPVPATVAAPAPAAGFVDKLWRVEPNSGVEAGTTYAFLRDGTLRIAAPHGTPATGQWRHADGRLTMIEDGIAYPTDIVSLDATHFVIRSHNPGGVVEIAMVTDAHATLPPP